MSFDTRRGMSQQPLCGGQVERHAESIEPLRVFFIQQFSMNGNVLISTTLIIFSPLK